MSDRRTEIVANAARLLGDAKLLSDNGRFASAFALAVLGLEELGKVVLAVC
jgi:AbiV family abortive infection protein